MSAHIYCWSPSLDLAPQDPHFDERVSALHDETLPPSEALVAFVNALLLRYPDLDDYDNDTIWADGPLLENIIGDFVNLGISWSRYDREAISFILDTAHKHGLHYYDPQEDKFHPAPGL